MITPPATPPLPESVLQRLLEYFTTAKGWLSVVPTLITLLDAAKGWLPISAVLKPWVYVLIVLLTFFAVWMEVSKTAGVTLNDDQKKHMRRKAAVHMVVGVVLIGGYWIFGSVLEAFTPQQVVSRTLSLFALACILGLVFAEISRAFAILALATD
jgi:hypothetical protein